MVYSHNIIPEEEEHCVWMDAGLVNYKLCVNAFECETCPFDVVMREQHKTFAEQASVEICRPHPEHRQSFLKGSELSESIDKLLKPFQSIYFPEDRIYFSSHTWMKKMNDGTVRIGIDEFLARLLHPVTAVAVVLVPSHIRQGEPFAWLIRNSTTFAIHNDISGIASATNFRLNDKPSLLTSDPYHDGWLMTLSRSCSSNPGLKFFMAKEFDVLVRREIGKLSQILYSDTNKHEVAGSTLYDGGTRLETVEQFIGEKRYNKFLLRQMSPH